MPVLRSFPTRLLVQRPSATTTQYTVSNRRPKETKVAQAVDTVSVAARAVSALWLAYLWLQLLIEMFASMNGEQQPRYTGPVHDQFRDLGLTATKQMSWITIAVLTLLLWTLSKRDGFEESLLVIRGLGIQISTSSPSYLSSTSTRFIPTTQIQDIFIHEAFQGFEVKFYLAVIVEGEKEVVVVFPKLMPRLEILEEVWRGSKEVLYQKSKA